MEVSDETLGDAELSLELAHAWDHDATGSATACVKHLLTEVMSSCQASCRAGKVMLS